MDVDWTRDRVLSHPRITGEKRRLCLAALDSYAALTAETSVSRDDLSVIERAARSGKVAPAEIGGRALAALACRHAAAREAFRDLMASGRRDDRLRAVMCLSSWMPVRLVREVLRLGFHDRSEVVRGQAAAACDTLGRRELLPALEERADAESLPWAKHKFLFHAAMLRDGYLVERKEGRLYLTARTASGGWASCGITRADLDAGRVPALVAEMRGQ